MRKCMGGCGTEIDEGLYCLGCAGQPDSAPYLRNGFSQALVYDDPVEVTETESVDEPEHLG